MTRQRRRLRHDRAVFRDGVVVLAAVVVDFRRSEIGLQILRRGAAERARRPCAAAFFQR